MTGREHRYEVTVRWTGNRGTGTKDYRGYGRDHVVEAAGKGEIAGSSDPTFRGDKTRWNPEELLVAALSQCHMLSFLHVCVTMGLVVESYEDHPVGVMAERAGGSGAFTQVTLHPEVVFSAGDMSQADVAHEKAHHLCFIANSVNFPVMIEAESRRAS